MKLIKITKITGRVLGHRVHSVEKVYIAFYQWRIYKGDWGDMSQGQKLNCQLKQPGKAI